MRYIRGTTPIDGDDVLEQLRRVDDRGMSISPWVIGSHSEPSLTARTLAEWLERASLADDVPKDVQLNFERVRQCFLHGLLDYELFTAASDLAHLSLEGALRHRFISYYSGAVPIVRGKVADVIVASSFKEYRDALPGLRKDNEPPPRLKGGHPLPRTYRELYTWARRLDLLAGQRNVGVFSALVKMRHSAAHPERYTLNMPLNALSDLSDVAEIINRLWGHNTEGGRLFPGPVSRRARAAALSPDGAASVEFSSVPVDPFQHDTGDWTYAVFLAADREELVTFDWDNTGGQRFAHTPGFQTTHYPTELVYGPGSHADLRDAFSALDNADLNDRVDYLDRRFYIRVTDRAERPEFPRTAVDILETKPSRLCDQSARWYVLQADFPMDAWVLVRDNAAALSTARDETGFLHLLTGDDDARKHAARD
ncbi:MAG TPA: hypothetical protein VGH52_00670 [Gaiellaceae bacterium]|jgi:hypothetical protein